MKDIGRANGVKLRLTVQLEGINGLKDAAIEVSAVILDVDVMGVRIPDYRLPLPQPIWVSDGDSVELPLVVA